MSHYTMLYKYGERKREFFLVFLFSFYFSFLYWRGIFNKTIIPLAPVGYEMIIAIYHLISNARSWNNC